MPTPTTCVFDLVPPRRPALTDVGGGAKQDDPNPSFAPNVVTMPTAADENQAENLLVAYGKVVAHTKVTIHLDGGGNPVVNQVTSTIQAVTAIAATPFTIALISAGIFDLSWPANTFPAKTGDHTGVPVGTTGGQCTVETLTNKVTVRTFSVTGTPAYRACVIELN